MGEAAYKGFRRRRGAARPVPLSSPALGVSLSRRGDVRPCVRAGGRVSFVSCVRSSLLSLAERGGGPGSVCNGPVRVACWAFCLLSSRLLVAGSNGSRHGWRTCVPMTCGPSRMFPWARRNPLRVVVSGTMGMGGESSTRAGRAF